MRGHIVRRIRHKIANRGVGGASVEVLRRFLLTVARVLTGSVLRDKPARSIAAVHPFDEQYGVDTNGLIWGERLASVYPNRHWATGYSGIAPSVFWQALDRLNLDWNRFTFIDVGSGKGRALMLALRYPFRRLIGIEFSADFVRTSKMNLENFSAEWSVGSPVEVFEADAVRFPLPLEPSVLFLFNPFAKPVMLRFVEHLRSSLREQPREIYLVYADPQLSQIISSANFLSKVWDKLFTMNAEDFEADYFGRRRERVAVYIGNLKAAP
jgi:SAM-dependent methyltransferase